MVVMSRPAARNPARNAAWKVLVQSENCKKTVKDQLKTLQPGLDRRDKALSLELLLGVQRHRALLDWTLAGFMKKPIEKTPVAALAAMRLGAYQILFMDKIPDHCAVDESVEIAKINLGNSFARLVNAVLRNLLRTLPTLSPPKPQDNPTQNIPITLSHPAWLVNRWIKRLGPDETEALCRANNKIPPISLRVNILKTDVSHLLCELKKHGIGAEPSSHCPHGIRLLGGVSIRDIPEQLWPLFQVQDEAAQLVAPLLGAGPGERILDACAAPGGKTTHIAELMKDQGTIVALDKDARRLSRLSENIKRLGLHSVKIVHGDLLSEQNLGYFDKILLDAPCSALGVIRRNPDIKWCRREADLKRNQKTQGRLLEKAADMLKPSGGKLLYAVCSNEPEECEEVIEEFLQKRPFKIIDIGNSASDERFFRTMPHSNDIDGFFAALLTKN